MGRLLAREYLRSSTLKAALKIGMPAEPATTDTGKNGVQKTGTMRERERKKRRLGRRRRRKNTAKSSCIIQNSLQSSLMNKLESISNITCDCVCVCVRARALHVLAMIQSMLTILHHKCIHFTQVHSSFYTTNALTILHHKCNHHFTPRVHSPFYTTICTHHFTAQVHLLFYTTSSLTIFTPQVCSSLDTSALTILHKCTHHLTPQVQVLTPW